MVRDLLSTSTKPASAIGGVRTFEAASGFFDTTDNPASATQQYHMDNHEDIVGEVGSDTPESAERVATIPYSWAIQTTENNMEDVDIVTAAEHLRAAADCLAKLTGRGDGVMFGADVEDVLGVVFEK